MTEHDMLTAAAVGFILVCWAVERPAWAKWIGLVLGVAVVGAIVVHSSSKAARYSETNERDHHRKGCGHGHHRRRRGAHRY